MSHITDGKLRINDLGALAEAAEAVGLVFMEGQTQHAWFGRFVGDTTPPVGRNPAQFGKCEHALRLKDHRPGDYEIGVVPALDGNGLDLMWDTWGTSGRRLQDAAGRNMDRLRQEYAAAVAVKQARAKLTRKGFTVQREALPDGRIRVRLRKR